MANGSDIVNYMKQFIGTPYVWGGNSLTSGVDCSGLMVQGFKHFGINLNRTTYDQIGQGQAVSSKGLRPGDLVFFDTDPNTSGPDHVGVYMGNGKMLHAPRPGKNVEITDMTKGYYMDRFMGGRRMDGVKNSGASSNDFAAPEEVKMTPEELAASYGWAYGFLNGNKDLKKKFDQAVKETWSPDKFQAEIRDTDWWKKTSETARQAELQKSTDPATYQASVGATTIMVRQLASKMGAAIPESKMKGIVESALRTGLDQDEDGLRNVLGQYVQFTKDGTLKGEAGMHEYTMKQYASKMGVKMNDQAIKNQAQLVVRKMATTQDYESQVRKQAISAFPGYADQIEAGATMEDIASPYEQMMTKELELPGVPDMLSDPTIRSALNGLNTDGKPTGMSLTDFQSSVRSDPRWAKTTGARNATVDIGVNVLRDMGLVAPGGSGG
jgi:hypothetical protein